jgi:hypothetical protein
MRATYSCNTECSLRMRLVRDLSLVQLHGVREREESMPLSLVRDLILVT